MLKMNSPAPEFEFEDQRGKKFRFPMDFKGKWLALFFLRHLGCPLCMEKINELKTSRGKYQTKGVEIFVVAQSTLNRVRQYAQKKGIDFFLIGDYEKRLYALYQVFPGGISALLSPKVLVATIRATLKGNLHGKFEGDELQKPAVFIIDPEGKLAYVEYGRDIASVMDERRFFEVLEPLKGKAK